jgi:hypothetical protein
MFGNEWREESPIFNPSWFGAAAPPNGSHIVEIGQWAYTPVVRDALSGTMFSHYGKGGISLTNSYGLVRAVWNMNPTPYIGRWKRDWATNKTKRDYPSGCGTYERILKIDSWMELQKSFNTAGHGFIHGLVGGSWSEAPEPAILFPNTVYPAS